MRNYFNELYAKDSSKQVRILKRAQAECEELLGGRPPYGYKRDDSVRKGIVPDEEAAGVVKRIFGLCAEGKGPNQIARLLTKEQVLTPTNYYYRKTGAPHASLDTTRPYSWSGSTVTGTKSGHRSRWMSRICSRDWCTVPTAERRWCSTGRIRWMR